MTKKLFTILFLPILICGSLPLLGLSKPVHADNPSVLITEVQTGYTNDSGTEFPLQEFVELSNTTNQRVEVSHWRIEYLSAANNGSGGPTSVIGELNGHIIANGHALASHAGYMPNVIDLQFGDGDTSTSGFLAKTGGHVRLMNGTTMVDCVSWGSAVAIDGCDKVSSVPPAKNTIQRLYTNNTYTKSLGVVNASPPNPQGGDLFTDINDPLPSDPVVPNDPAPVPTFPQTCDHVILSEIFANPAGDDTAGEYIELFNTAENSEPLLGCGLHLANGKIYNFAADAMLAPHEYRAFPFYTTNLQLSNSGTTVSLVTPTQQIDVTYPALGDDEAWALINGAWVITKKATPNQPNVLAGADVSAAADGETPADSANSCPAGKERNPATNRCRNIVVTASTAVPCQAGEERNPATNRCRKVTAAQSTQKPCDPGQERNPETNRCHKVEPSGKVLATNSSKNKTGFNYHVVIIGVVLMGIAGYAVYEYRTDLLVRWQSLKYRFTKSKVKN